MHVVLSLICFMSHYSIKQNSFFYFLNVFGFQKSAVFEFNFSKSLNTGFIITFPNQKEVNYVKDYVFKLKNTSYENAKKFLLAKKIIHNEFLNGNHGLKGVIQKSGYYQPAIIVCNDNFSQYELDVRFINPSSHLDSRKIPCLYSRPITLLFLTLLIIFWLYNWFSNFTLNNPLHLYLTITFIITFLYFLIDTLNLFHQHYSDDPTILNDISISLRFFEELLILTAMMMAAKGWCIIFEHVAWIDVVTSVIYSVLFSLPILLLDNISTNVFVLFALFIIGFFGCFTYYNELISNIEEANSVVAAHLLIISQDGIDPETTPIYKKFQIFKTITDAVVWYFTIMMFRTILFELLNIPDFIMTIIYDIATIALLITTAYAFKLKKSLRNGYIMVGENTDSVEFTLDDIERLNEDNEIQRNATTPWHEGMPLPSQPRINRHFQANIPCVDSSSNKENSETNENLESHA